MQNKGLEGGSGCLARGGRARRAAAAQRLGRAKARPARHKFLGGQGGEGDLGASQKGGGRGARRGQGACLLCCRLGEGGGGGASAAGSEKAGGGAGERVGGSGAGTMRAAEHCAEASHQSRGWASAREHVLCLAEGSAVLPATAAVGAGHCACETGARARLCGGDGPAALLLLLLLSA